MNLKVCKTVSQLAAVNPQSALRHLGNLSINKNHENS